jgi:hypothetical protein
MGSVVRVELGEQAQQVVFTVASAMPSRLPISALVTA